MDDDMYEDKDVRIRFALADPAMIVASRKWRWKNATVTEQQGEKDD